MIGEILSWIGLGIGIPLLIVAEIIRVVQSRWVPVEITVVRIGEVLTARWFAGGDHWERPVRLDEPVVGEGPCAGYVRARKPQMVRFSGPSPTQKTCAIAGGVLTGAGVLGFVLSWIPPLL